jgi:hypothetical protein
MQDPVQSALQSLAQALDAPRPEAGDSAASGRWRWTVRQQMTEVRDTLARETAHAHDGWLAAREFSVLRERNVLLTRMAALGPVVLESPEIDGVRHQVRRLVADIAHHRQRIHDLAYDAVEMELGGSE